MQPWLRITALKESQDLELGYLKAIVLTPLPVSGGWSLEIVILFVEDIRANIFALI